jgi:hypothetical protein
VRMDTVLSESEYTKLIDVFISECGAFLGRCLSLEEIHHLAAAELIRIPKSVSA